MIQLETVTVHYQNPHTNRPNGRGVKRKAMIEYGENGFITAMYTASPNINGSGVVVFRKPIESVYFINNNEKVVTVSLLNSDLMQDVITQEQFDANYYGLPVTM